MFEKYEVLKLDKKTYDIQIMLKQNNFIKKRIPDPEHSRGVFLGIKYTIFYNFILFNTNLIYNIHDN